MATESQNIPESEQVETITALRVRARNNYTCRDEQDITTWENDNDEITQVDVAEGLDRASLEDVERRGYGGTGAGAILLATIDGIEEEIESMDHPAVRALPVGSIKTLRQNIAEMRDEEVWDGHNHVSCGAPASESLLHRIRYDG